MKDVKKMSPSEIEDELDRITKVILQDHASLIDRVRKYQKAFEQTREIGKSVIEINEKALANLHRFFELKDRYESMNEKTEPIKP